MMMGLVVCLEGMGNEKFLRGEELIVSFTYSSYSKFCV